MKSKLKIVACLCLSIAIMSCAKQAETTEVKKKEYNAQSTKWPTPKSHEVQVMLLGTFHMANPGLDANNIDADDVRSARRQKELKDLADRLAVFKPDVIATEIDYKVQNILDSLYVNVPIDTLLTKRKNEIFQVGYRLGKMLNLPRVYAIDFPMMMGNDSLTALNKRYKNGIPHKIKYPNLDWKKINKEQDSLLHVSTINDYLINVNKEENLMLNHYGMFAGIRKGENDNFGGALNLSKWYERNFKMAHNIYRASTPETKRILLIVGSGHVNALRHILDESPMFCPVSPMPYLEN